MKANQLSKTASFIAIKFYGLTKVDTFRSLFDDSVVTYYDHLVQQLPSPLRHYHFWLKFKWIRQLYLWSEELLLPGDLLHVIARKWYMQRIIDNTLDQEYEQLLVLGAGFDHLGFYYSQKGLPCFEVDTPHMTKQKQRFLQEQYPGQSHPEMIDLLLPNNRLAQVISDHPNVDPHKKTIVVAEGFFDYLRPDTVRNVLKDTQEYFSHKPVLISTHFALNELSPFRRKVFKLSVQLAGEPLQLDSSIEAFSRSLSDSGYKVRQMYDSQEIKEILRNHTDTAMPMLRGFYLLTAK